MIYKFILAIYITSWIYLVYETIRTWKYNTFKQFHNLGIISMISLILTMLLFLIFLMAVAPITCVCYGWNKSKGKMTGCNFTINTDGKATTTPTTFEDKKEKDK